MFYTFHFKVADEEGDQGTPRRDLEKECGQRASGSAVGRWRRQHERELYWQRQGISQLSRHFVKFYLSFPRLYRRIKHDRGAVQLHVDSDPSVHVCSSLITASSEFRQL